MQHFLGDPESGMLNLETHRLALVIAKKTLDENRLKAARKTMARDKPAFQIGDHVYFRNKQPGKWDLKWRPRYRIICIENDGHFIRIENQATGKIWSCNVTDIILELPIEFWDVDMQFGRAGRYVYHPANLPPIKLVDTSLKKHCTANNNHASTLQHSVHAYPHHKLVRKGIGRISHFSTSSAGMSNMSLLDYNNMFP